MRLGIVSTWFERGAAYVSRQYRSVLASSGYEVRIYARGGERYAKGDPVWDTSDVTWGKRVQQPWGGTYIDRQDFEAWIRREGITILLFNEQQWWPPILWAKELGIPCVAYIDYYTEETLPFFDLYDAIICNTKRHESAFSWHRNCLFIPWGTNTSIFKPQVKKLRFSNKIVFFHSCGLAPFRKGTDLALKAFEHTNGDSRFVLHTQRNIHDVFPDISPLIQRLQREGRLTIYEGDVHAPGLYHHGDVYVYPSRLEGIGLTQAEALSSGLPIIVPDTPPMNEFVTPENGIAVPIDRLWARADGYYWPQCVVNIESLARAMQLYVDDQAHLAAAKMAARTYATAKLDWAKNAQRLGSLLENVEYTEASSALWASIQAFYHRRANFSQRMALKSHRLWQVSNSALRASAFLSRKVRGK